MSGSLLKAAVRIPQPGHIYCRILAEHHLQFGRRAHDCVKATDFDLGIPIMGRMQILEEG